MPVIHKYVIQPSEQIQQITVPTGSKIVSCGVQDSQMIMWVMKIQDTSDLDSMDYLRYMVVGTGWPIDGREYFPDFRGTIQIDGYVWHVLEMQKYDWVREDI